MKKLIIALAVSVLMVFSAFVCYADFSDTSEQIQTITIPAKKADSKIKANNQPVILSGYDDEIPSGGASGGGGGSVTPTPVPDVSEDYDEEDYGYGKILVYDAYSYNFYMSENTFDVILRFGDIHYLEDARTALSINVYDDNTQELVASSINAAYVNDYNGEIRYTLMLTDDAEIIEDNPYYLELVYSGNAQFTSDIDYFYLYPDTCESIVNYIVKDKSTATIDLKISNLDDDAVYYAYIWDYDKYYMPLSRKDGVLTLSFDDVMQYYRDYNSIEMHVDIYKSYMSMPANPNPYNDTYIGGLFIYYEFLSNATFEENKWNGVEIDGPIPDGAESFKITIEGGENASSTNADGQKYKPEDAEFIEISIYNETLGTKLDAEAEIKVCEYEKEEGYIFFDTIVTSEEPLDSEYSYYLVVKDRYSTRIKKIIFADGPSVGSVTVNDSEFESFTKADVYNIVINSVINMPDPDKFDIRFYSNYSEEIAEFDRNTLKIENTDFGDVYTLEMNDIAPDRVNMYSDHFLNIYYDGEFVSSNRFYLTEYYDDYEEYLDVYVENSYCVNDEKIVFVARCYTNIDDFNIDDCEFYLHSDYNYDYIFEDGTITDLYTTEWGMTYYLFEYDITDPSVDYYNLCLRYTYNGEEYSTTFGLREFIYEDSFMFDIREKDTENFYLFGYNLPESEWNLLLTDEMTDEQISVPGATISPYHIAFDYEAIPGNKMLPIAYLECDGRLSYVIELYQFSYDRTYGESMYSQYLNQNTRIAIINLPYKLYDSYRIALSEEELDYADYFEMENQTVVILPEENGTYFVYAQFIDENGDESEVYKTKLAINRTTPVFEFEEDLSGSHVSDNFNLETNMTIDRRGTLYYQFYTKYDTPFGWERAYEIEEGQNYFYTNLNVYSSDGDVSAINRIDFWFIDEYGNRSETLSYDITIRSRYVYEYIGDGYIYFDTVEGCINNIYNISGHLTIPSMIAGSIVRQISSWVLTSYENLTSVSIPSTVTYMSRYSFYDKRDIIFYVKENSYAHTVLLDNGYTVIATGNPGDINSDRVVNGADLLRLAKYFADWDVVINEETADVNADGEISVADLLRLAKYIAGHNVVLGE